VKAAGAKSGVYGDTHNRTEVSRMKAQINLKTPYRCVEASAVVGGDTEYFSRLCCHCTISP
jgi:hypothetical protein